MPKRSCLMERKFQLPPLSPPDGITDFLLRLWKRRLCACAVRRAHVSKHFNTACAYWYHHCVIQYWWYRIFGIGIGPSLSCGMLLHTMGIGHTCVTQSDRHIQICSTQIDGAHWREAKMRMRIPSCYTWCLLWMKLGYRRSRTRYHVLAVSSQVHGTFILTICTKYAWCVHVWSIQVSIASVCKLVWWWYLYCLIPIRHELWSNFLACRSEYYNHTHTHTHTHTAVPVPFSNFWIWVAPLLNHVHTATYLV